MTTSKRTAFRVFPRASGRTAHRRFSRGDGVAHALWGKGVVSNTGHREVCPVTGQLQWVCLVAFEAHAKTYSPAWGLIAESDLVSLPGTGRDKYGQGKQGCRVGSSRYGERNAERQSVNNGRTVTRRLTTFHNGPKAR